MGNTAINQPTDDPVINLALDTLAKKKQALVFVNAKKSAEKNAEEISKNIKDTNNNLKELSEKIKNVLGKPTQQCERLARCVLKGIAFHHAGLHSKQKEIVEENFRNGSIAIICCTPTLAAGLDLPAFRAIIRDVKRYAGRFGMDYIPVLEFHQMAGRAGRPKFDSYGEAIAVANTKSEKNNIYTKYVLGTPEEIYSKLAVEPVLRTYLLSLIASKLVQTKDEIDVFFRKTFWAYQFREMPELGRKLQKMLGLLAEWGFIHFADEKYRATILGKRVAELYLDPLTAHELIKGLEAAAEVRIKPYSLLQLVCNTLEMMPLLKVKAREIDLLQEEIAKYHIYMLDREPSMFEPEFEDYLNSCKTALMLHDWIEEKDEEHILEHYDCRPGETRAKLEKAEWLLYGLSELARIMQKQELIKEIAKLRFRLRYGVKEELLALLRLKGIGRVRARLLYRNGIKDLGDARKADVETLIRILGKQIALDVKKQLGEKLEEKWLEEFIDAKAKKIESERSED